MKNLIGKTTYLTKESATWMLNNPEIYETGSIVANPAQYDTETQLNLMCLFGVPIKGKILKYGIIEPDYQTVFVEYRQGKLKMSFYVEPKDLQFEP